MRKLYADTTRTFRIALRVVPFLHSLHTRSLEIIYLYVLPATVLSRTSTVVAIVPELFVSVIACVHWTSGESVGFAMAASLFQAALLHADIDRKP